MDRKKLIDAAIEAGWTMEKRKSGHLKLTSPKGDIIFTASTPSDWRATKNLASQLRKLGVQI